MKIESVNFGAKPLSESKSTKPEIKTEKKDPAKSHTKVVLSLLGLGIAGFTGVKIYQKNVKTKEKEAVLGKSTAVIEKAEQKMREMFPDFHDNEIHLLTKLHLIFKADKLKNATQKPQVPHTIILLGDDRAKILSVQNQIQKITDAEVKNSEPARFWAGKEDKTRVKPHEKQLAHDIKEAQKLFEEDKTRTIFDFGKIRNSYNAAAEANKNMPEESAKSGVHALISAEKTEELSEKIKKDAFIIPLKNTPVDPSKGKLLDDSDVSYAILEGLSYIDLGALF